jgi:lipoate-protein ligase A
MSLGKNLHSHFILSESLDPFWNLSKEEQLLDHCDSETTLLFVYCNNPSVVIGKHQNPWAESWMTELLTCGVPLVRRNSGGGTVFHDAGNLNFSFIAPREIYTPARHFELVLETLRKHGLSPELNGQNDLVMEGFKFSGSAFCYRKNTACHHGTLLVSSDLERLNRFLKKKDPWIHSHAIRSRPSLVCNLSSWNQDLTVDMLKTDLWDVFRERASADVSFYKVGERDKEDPAFQDLYRKYRSWEWNFAKTPEFSFVWNIAGTPVKINVVEGKVGEFFFGEKVFPELSGCDFSLNMLGKLIETLQNQETLLSVLRTLEENVFGKV